MTQSELKAKINQVSKLLDAHMSKYYTEKVIRFVSPVARPSLGLKQGDVFYLARNSKGGYHVVTWSYINCRWECPCICGKKHNHSVLCYHVKNVSADCKLRKETRVLVEAEQVAAQAEKRMVAPLNSNNRAFSILR